MAAGLRALGDDGVGAGVHQPLGEDGGGYHGDHLDARCLPGRDVFAGVAGAGGDHLDAFLKNDLRHLVGTGVHQHQIDAERLVRQALADADLLPEHFRLFHVAGGDDAQGTGIGAGGGEFASGDVGHAALDDGELRSQNLVQLFHIFSYLDKAAWPALWGGAGSPACKHFRQDRKS